MIIFYKNRIYNFDNIVSIGKTLSHTIFVETITDMEEFEFDILEDADTAFLRIQEGLKSELVYVDLDEDY